MDNKVSQRYRISGYYRKRKFLNGKNRIVFLELNFTWVKQYISIGAWFKSWQLPYSNQEKFWPIMVWAVEGDTLPFRLIELVPNHYWITMSVYACHITSRMHPPSTASSHSQTEKPLITFKNCSFRGNYNKPVIEFFLKPFYWCLPRRAKVGIRFSISLIKTRYCSLGSRY